jgi:eukaryotic-like serine/threonine-protein kinase
VTYELLSGRPPYEFESLAELPVKQREGPPPPIDGVSEELQDAVRRCLAPDPANRPASAAALAHELAQASPEPPTQPLPAEATAATQVISRPRREVHASRTQVAGAAVLGIAALAAGLAFGLTRGDDDSPPPAQPLRVEAVPRGDTPTESARVLADWLRARAG